jgi:hypothetical protein
VKRLGLGRGGLILVPLAAGKGRHLLSMSLSGGKVHHQDPLCLVRGLVLQWHMRLNRGSGMLAGELVSPWRYPLLDDGLPSAGLHLLPPVMSVTLPKREDGFHPRGNRHHGWSILHPWCGCDRSERSPRASPSGTGEAKAPLPTCRGEELLDGVLYHGLE